MPKPPDVVMAKSIYDENELLPVAYVINQSSDLKQPLVNPDMNRSNNRSSQDDNCDDCCDCDGCCDDDTLLLCCCICCVCDN